MCRCLAVSAICLISRHLMLILCETVSVDQTDEGPWCVKVGNEVEVEACLSLVCSVKGCPMNANSKAAVI